jgi:hypothetical protein
MKKGQKDTGDKSKKKGWGARLMSLIAGSSDEELAPSDDDQDDLPRGKGGSGSGAAAKVVQADPAPLDSRASLKRMLKDPEQKKVKLEVNSHPTMPADPAVAGGVRICRVLGNGRQPGPRISVDCC